jgi:hypothetical protein
MPGSGLAKITGPLAEQVAASADDDVVDVVAELRPIDVPTEGSRSHRIEAVRDAFKQDVSGVEDVIVSSGGEVLDTAWINQTLRALLPAKAIPRVAEDDRVLVLDVPHRIEPD